MIFENLNRVGFFLVNFLLLAEFLFLKLTCRLVTKNALTNFRSWLVLTNVGPLVTGLPTTMPTTLLRSKNVLNIEI
jgi:hypothetical protein